LKAIIVFILVLISSLTGIASGQGKIYVANIDGEIDLGLSPFISRVITEAEQNKAEVIIFKINTFGGRVDAATQIKDVILSSKIPTVAFINNRAVSAGALIALSCRKIAMVPGSVIGAATVVDEAGQKVSEKYQSYMRSEMRSTAERNGRRTDIAQGMVDERIVVAGLDDDSTKLISLTAAEAKQFGIADTVTNNINAVISAFGFKGNIVEQSSNWAEDVVSFLNNPIISSLLIMVGLLGLYAEIKTPGWGLAGTAALVALALFFGSSYILQLASILEILLFVLGLVLLVLEIFVIPGFGIAGIGGILLIITSLFLALIDTKMPYIDFSLISTAIIQLSVALAGSIGLMFLLAKFLPKSTLFNTLVLAESESADKGFVSYPSVKELIGTEGVALTTLRPAGTAEFNGQRVDVVADWDYVEKGSKIKVLKVEGIKVVVEEIKETTPEP
jgi:membrane-bound serine protease (ClpP class)